MITLKKWSGSAWVEESPKVGISTIVASGTPSASTYLRGDGAWATPANTNYYPTAFAWANGTTSGPTGSLTGTGMSAVSFGAIPSASESVSGIVTTGAQTFIGIKTFICAIAGSVSGNAGTATKLAAPVNINGVSFDGSASITVYDGSKLSLTGGEVNGKIMSYTSDTTGTYHTRSIELREVGLVTNTQSASNYAPALAFHWGGRTQTQIALLADGKLVVRTDTGNGNAIILEGDSRLTNSRPASDVYAWAKAANPPTPGAIGAMPTSGGTFTGNVTIDTTSGNMPQDSKTVIFKYNGGLIGGGISEKSLYVDSGGILRLDGTALSLAGHSHSYAELTGTVPTWNQDTTGNAATATTANTANTAGKWTSPITLTIGGSSQFLDGTTGLSYSLASIGAAPSSHSHGGISSGGLISTETSMGTGDAILLADSSDSGRVIKSDITLDTTNTTQYLRRDGAWVTPPTASHTHGDISNTGTITSTAVTPASGDYILISDTSASGIIKRAIALGSSTTTFLRNDGTWQTGTGAVQSVNGLTGALNTQSLITANTTVNSVTYGRTYGIAQQTSGGSKLRIASGFYAPSATSSGNVISFGTTFTNAPMVVAFCLKAGSTTATVIGAKVTAVSATGCTIISSWAGASSTGYTPAAETYGWIAIGY